jgi:hypothetical protein
VLYQGWWSLRQKWTIIAIKRLTHSMLGKATFWPRILTLEFENPRYSPWSSQCDLCVPETKNHLERVSFRIVCEHSNVARGGYYMFSAMTQTECTRDGKVENSNSRTTVVFHKHPVCQRPHLVLRIRGF